MKLYISAASSYSRKIRVMLIEKGVPHEIETVNLWQPNDLKKTNPLGKVPALKLDDGSVLFDSPLIADWLDDRYPNLRFIPEDPAQRTEVRRWEALADGTMDAVAASLYELRFHDEARRSQDWLDRQRGKFEAGFGAMEQQLGGRHWCVGQSMSLADISLACHIGFVTLRRPEWFPESSYAGLTRLCRRLESRESFIRTAPPPA
jgi:glutathione S-transferase